MSEENKVVELNDDELKKVTGGEGSPGSPDRSKYGCPWNYTVCNKTNCYDRPDGICSNLYYYSSTVLHCSKQVYGYVSLDKQKDPNKNN